MASFTTTAKNEALDAITVDLAQLHSGDPGADGTANALGAKQSVNFGESAADPGDNDVHRQLVTDVEFTGLGEESTIWGCTLWEDGGTEADIFKGSLPRVSGDTAANVAGDYTLKKDDTKFFLNDIAA